MQVVFFGLEADENCIVGGLRLLDNEIYYAY